MDTMKQVPDIRAENSKEDMSYSDYMSMLQNEIPVSEYMLKPQTALIAIGGMFLLTIIFYFLLPVIMFRTLTLAAWFVLVVGFIAATWLFYDYVYYPNEIEGQTTGVDNR